MTNNDNAMPAKFLPDSQRRLLWISFIGLTDFFAVSVHVRSG